MGDAVAQQLASWGISQAEAQQAGIFETPSAQQIYAEMEDRHALVIPYYNPDGSPKFFDRGRGLEPFGRLRYLGANGHSHPGFGGPGKAIRYTQPDHSGIAAYFWPGGDWLRIFADITIPILITEGEAKAIKGCLAGYCVIGLGGVFNFAERGGQLLPELAQINWQHRDVYVVYDSDAATNPNVLLAEARLVEELQRERGARCHIVRLPSDNGNKVGLDDYLKSHGADAFAALLRQTTKVNSLDIKIMQLNQSVAWIEREGMVYDLTNKLFIRKENFLNGSRYSALSHMTVGGGQKSNTVKKISVAKEWLTHPNAQRYDEIIFRPREGKVIKREEGGVSLNMWEGFESREGDVRPFLELTAHLFQNVEEDIRDIPLKLMIYKAQNPEIKIPLAIVITGPEGSGKTLWGDCLREAFGIYGRNVPPDNLSSDFRPWLEKPLLITVNEAEGQDMRKAAGKIRALVSDMVHPMNDKFRPVRDVNHYAQYIVTANDLSVGSFRSGDRRNIVVGAPKPQGRELYDRVGAWLKHGGPQALMHWLLNFDLKGWVPPDRAPMTAEKHLAYQEGLTLVQELAERMKASNETLITQWLDSSVAWARAMELSNIPQQAQAARAILDVAPTFQIRPWYTPQELLTMFPMIAQQLAGGRFFQTTPAGQLSRELREAGIQYLVNKDDHRGFMWRGQIRQYLVISGFDQYGGPVSQKEFEAAMNSWPNYGLLRGLRR